MAIIHSEQDHTVVELDDDDDGEWAAIHFTTNRGQRLGLAVNPGHDVMRLSVLDEDGEPDELIKVFNIEHLENPNLENDE